MGKTLSRTVLAAVLVLTACSTVRVTTDYDRSASFAEYRTYALAPYIEAVPLAPSSEAALRDALRTGLATRGLTEVSNNADLDVVRHVFTKEKIAVYQLPGWSYGGYPYRYGRYGMWAGAPLSYTDVSQYTEGTLLLDFVDAKTKKVVFRGVGTGTVGDPAANAERIREAVQKITRDFPAGASRGNP